MSSLARHPERHPTLHIVSLAEWPQKPINKCIIRLSPVSSRVLANSSITFKQLLPISIADFSGTSIIDEKNIDELVSKYIKHNRKRIQLLSKLQSQRILYKNHSSSMNNKSDKRKLLSEEHQSDCHNPRLVFLYGQNHHKKNNHTDLKLNIKEKISSKRSGAQQSTLRWAKFIANDQTNKKNYHREQLTKKNPDFQNNITIKSSGNLKNSKKKKPLKHGLSYISKRNIGQSSSSLRIRLTEQSQQRRQKEKRADYFGSPCSTKKTKFNDPNSKKINAFSISDFKHSQDENGTHKSNIIHQYYNSSTKMFLKQKKVHQYFAPIINQLQQAINELIMMTENQQTEILMLENLCSKNDRKITEKQRRRLNKIHNVERQQLKNYIYSLRSKIISMRKSNNGIEMVGTL